MVDRQSALAAHQRPRQASYDGATGVSFSEVQTYSLVQIAAWPETLHSVGLTATKLAGCDAAPAPGRAVFEGTRTLMRVEPLKWWVLSEAPQDASSLPALEATQGAVLDLSHSRTWLRVSGDKAAPLLNHFLPINLSDRAFPAGSVATTAMHHIGVTLWRDEDAFNLLLPRSFASSLFELFTDSASQYGYKFT